MKQSKYLKTLFATITIAITIFFSCKKQGIQEPEVFKAAGTAGKANPVQQTTATCSGDDGEHFITMDYAYALIRNYQKAVHEGKICDNFNTGGWTYAETFAAEVIQQILSQPGCCRFRIYNGLDANDNRLHLVLVGVNQYGSDILYCNDDSLHPDPGQCGGTGDLNLIGEKGLPCPEGCNNNEIAN